MKRTVFNKNGTIEYLTAKEFGILYYLFSHSRLVFSKEQIYEAVWGYDYNYGSRNLTSLIKKSERK